MWELDHKEGWVLMNWCLLTVVLEKTLESPLDNKEIQPVNPKGTQSWIFIGRTDAEAETPILWPPDVQNLCAEKTLTLGKIEGGRRRGRQSMRWLQGIIDSWTWVLENFGDSEGQGSLACCSLRSHREVRLHDWTTTNILSFPPHCTTLVWMHVYVCICVFPLFLSSQTIIFDLYDYFINISYIFNSEDS